MVAEYRSTDASAPVVSGAAGSLKNAMKSILVTGYGSISPAGWSNAFEEGNRIALRQGGANQHYLAVDDDAAQMTRLFGYESMSSATVGTGQFPGRDQVSGGLYARKSITADSTARPWICWANDTTFYMVVFGGSTSFDATGGDANLGFGKTQSSAVLGDAFNTFIAGGVDTSTTNTSFVSGRQVLSNSTTYANGAPGIYMARSHTQLGNAVNIGMAPNCPIHTTPISGGVQLAYPSEDGCLNLARIYMRNTHCVRGMMPGIWHIAHDAASSLGQLDTVSGKTGSSLDGRAFTIYKVGLNRAIAVETTEGSWNG